MADQDQVPQGAIPPKVSPFAKPEKVSPVTPVASGAPRPITVRLRPATLAVPNVVTEEKKQVPAPVPIHAQAPVTVPAPVATSDARSPRGTSRIPLPESIEAAVAAAAPNRGAATVRLRTVFTHGVEAPSSPSAVSQAAAPASTPVKAAALPPLQPQSPPKPGANPLPEGPKPPSGAQMQAAKSKTSRISLDSAIGVAPMTPMGSAAQNEPKTIRLKRPSDLAAPTTPVVKTPTTPIRQTSRIPDSALPTAESPDSAGVTQKKTLKIKRPGAKAEESGEEAKSATEAFAEGTQMTPVSSLEAAPAQESSLITTLSVVAACAALIVIGLLTWCLAAQAIGPVADVNSTASFTGPELPWAGSISK